MRAGRILLVVAMCAGVLVAKTTVVRAAVTCGPPVGTSLPISLTGSVVVVVLEVGPGGVMQTLDDTDTYYPEPVPCAGGASVTTINSISIGGGEGTQRFGLSLLGGPFAPGASDSDEAPGSMPEIEIGISNTVETLDISGTEASETFALGGQDINLNNDDDADVHNNLTLPQNTLVVGNGGNDVIDARGGNGTPANDYDTSIGVFGGSGDDMIFGTDAADAMGGDDGADRIEGGGGNDNLSGGADKDTVLGGDGDDTLDLVDRARDSGDCGNGNDTARIDKTKKRKKRDRLVPGTCETVIKQRPAA